MDRISKALARAKEARRFKPVVSDGAFPADADSEFPGALQADVPADFLRKMKIFAGDEADVTADSYKLLRTRVLHRMQERGWSTLGITSPRPRAGKTLTAINLALAIAKNPKYTVLLVDADMRNPSVHRMFGIEAERGLREFLTGDEELNSHLIRLNVPRLALLPTVEKTANSSELLSGARMQSLIDGFRRRAGSMVVIFDLPPVLFGDDVVVMSAKLDCLLMMIEDGTTRTSDLRRSMELLKHAEIIGSVLNKAHEPQPNDYEYYS